MKNCIVLAIILVCFGCGPQPDPARGTKTVATANCRDPQTAYHSNNVSLLNQLGLALPQYPETPCRFRGSEATLEAEF